MNIFRTIRSSAYDPAFYQRVKTEPLGQALKTFAILGAAGIGILMFVVYLAIIPFAHSGFLDTLEAAYPSDLVVTIAHGQMSLNKPEPYYIKNTLPLLSGADAPQNLVVFDGNDSLSSDLKENSTFAIVKKKFLIMQGSNSQSQIQSFAGIESTTTISRATVVGFIEPLRPYFGPAIIFGGALLFIVLALFFTMFWILGHLLYLLIPAGIVYLFEASRGLKTDYSQSYKVALYASIPSAVVFYVLSLAHAVIPIPFSYSILLLLIAAVNISEGQKLPSASQV